MPLISACIVPHAGPALPELAPDASVGAATRAAMAALGAELAALRPETLLLLTPHGVTIHGAIGVAITERAAGTIGAGPAVELRCDRELAVALCNAGSLMGLPMAPYWFGDGTLPLDWSTLIPLRFLGAGLRPRPQLVVVGPSGGVPREGLVAFGQALRQAADESPRRVALIASVDQGHAHVADGPYGYDPASALFDSMIQEIVAAGRLEKLLELDEEFVEASMPDSVESLLVLHGALSAGGYSCALRCYELFGYFGGLCASISFGPVPAMRATDQLSQQV